MPVPVATNSRCVAPSSYRITNVPAGPRKLVESPGRSASRYEEPGPFGTRLNSSVIASFRCGGDAIEYGLVRPNRRPGCGISNETNCPARNDMLGGSSSRRSSSRTSCVSSRRSMTVAVYVRTTRLSRAAWTLSGWCALGHHVGVRSRASGACVRGHAGCSQRDNGGADCAPVFGEPYLRARRGGPVREPAVGAEITVLVDRTPEVVGPIRWFRLVGL